MKKYIFEFITIFVGIFAAFALDNWKDSRAEHKTQTKILWEIKNGLKNDLTDIELNEKGHNQGIESAKYFRNLIMNSAASQDSFTQQYFNLLRSFVSLQNTSGYQTLKSKGLEIIENDSLRSQIINLYEYDYAALEKIEEEYPELQFLRIYNSDVSNPIAANANFNDRGMPVSLNTPLKISEKEKKVMLAALFKIQANREWALRNILEVKTKVINLQNKIKKELDL